MKFEMTEYMLRFTEGPHTGKYWALPTVCICGECFEVSEGPKAKGHYTSVTDVESVTKFATTFNANRGKKGEPHRLKVVAFKLTYEEMAES